MRFVGVLTSGGHLTLAFSMVARVAHVLGVVLLIEVVAEEHVLDLELSMTVLMEHGLTLEMAYRVFSELLGGEVSDVLGLLRDLDELFQLALEVVNFSGEQALDLQ